MTSPWPPASGLSTPSVHKSSAILPISASTNINAPASVVWSVLIDTTDWGSWNTFVPRVKFKSQPEGIDPDSKILYNGTLMIFDAVMDPKKPDKTAETQLRVVDIATPEEPTMDHVKALIEEGDESFSQSPTEFYRISWKAEGGYAGRGLLSERFHEIIVTGAETCEVRTWEVMGGILARTIKWLYKTSLHKRFEDWCRDLKTQSEKVYEESKA